MKYLLDTCTVSDFVKGEPSVLATIKRTSPDQIAISVVTRMEIEYGLLLNPQRARKLEPILDAFLSSVAVLPFDDADAKAAAAIRAALHQQGRPIGPYDCQLRAGARTGGRDLERSGVSAHQRAAHRELAEDVSAQSL